jgi:hypothetical protein
MGITEMTTLYIRPTTMGLAFFAAAERSIIKAGDTATKAVHNPKIHWVARRILTSQSKIGMKTEAGAMPALPAGKPGTNGKSRKIV